MGLILLSLLLILAAIDAQTQLPPDRLTPAAAVGRAGSILPISLRCAAYEAVVGAMAGIYRCGQCTVSPAQLTGSRRWGYGGFQAAGGAGAWLGWQALPRHAAAGFRQRPDLDAAAPGNPLCSNSPWLGLRLAFRWRAAASFRPEQNILLRSRCA